MSTETVISPDGTRIACDGSEDQPVMASFDHFRKQLDGSSVQAIIVDGLDREHG